MDEPRQTRKLRSKTGCRTCRIRRVKCDEQLPDCQRCTSTGRKCEWFDIFFNASNQARSNCPAKIASGSQKIPCPPAEFPDAKILELRGFEFFKLRTAPEMCQAFDFGFWQRLVLQLGQTEPTILHGAIALGTLHEMEESLGMPISKDRLTNTKHRFAVTQYNTAIKLLNEQAATQTSSRSQMLILATSLIFTHIDLLRGHYKLAVVHIRGALKILDESDTSLPFEVETIMRTAFLRLDIQAVHFDRENPYARQPIDQPIAHLPLLLDLKFDSILVGKEQYDKLLWYTFRLLRQCEGYVLNRQWEYLKDDGIRIQQQNLLSMHDNFIHHLEDVWCCNSTALSKPQDQQATILLQIHAKITRMLLSVFMNQDIEGSFDDFAHEFESIVALSKLFISSLKGETRISPKLPSFSTDWGIIFPLAFTVLKCRNTMIRREALDILDSWHHREGFWDSSLVVTCGLQVVALEGCNDTSSEVEPVSLATNVFVEVGEHQQDAKLSWDWNGTNSPESARNTINIAI